MEIRGNDARDLNKARHKRWRLAALGAAGLTAVSVAAAVHGMPAGAATTRTAATSRTAATTRTAADPSCRWVTSTAPISQRVAQLMNAMTLSDKITMVEGHGTTNPYVFYTPAIPALCIPAVGLEDGPNGVGDGLTGVTQLPSGVALAATFDPSLASQYGSVIGAEEAARAPAPTSARR
jgi:beta-glucosidase